MFVRFETEDIFCGRATMAHSALALFDCTGEEKGVFCFRGKFSISANSLQTRLKYGSC